MADPVPGQEDHLHFAGAAYHVRGRWLAIRCVQRLFPHFFEESGVGDSGAADYA